MKTFKMAFRNLLKNKSVSLINLIGLTLGVVISLLLLTYVQQEKSTDKFITDYDNIYLITKNDGDYDLSKPMVDLVKNNLSGIPVTYVGLNWAHQVYLSDINQNKFKVPSLLDADKNFFTVFQFEPLWGNPQEALNSSNKIVLTESLSRKIFGEINSVGKTLHLNTSYLNNEMVEIGAVIKDLPQNTSWSFNAVLSIETNYKISWYLKSANYWGAQNYNAFCRIPKKENHLHVQEQMHKLSKSNMIAEGYKNKLKFGIEPYAQQYFNMEGPNELKHGNIKTLNILQLIAILILVMATINYINLVSAQRQKRNKNIAILQMLGSKKWGVIKLLAAEALIMLSGVLLLFMIVSPFAVRLLNNLLDTNYATSFLLSKTALFILSGIFIFLFIITGIGSGWLFSRQQAMKLLKPNTTSPKASFIRNALPVTQFIISIALIISLLFMKKQNDMMLNQNPGFNKENIVYATTNEDILKNSQSFINEIKKISNISDLTFSDEPFVTGTQHWGLRFAYKGENKQVNFAKLGVSPNFFDFFGLKLKDGRKFIENANNDNLFIMNESAIKEFGFVDYEKAHLPNNNEGRIIGVIEDFNFTSAHNPIMPLAFMCEGKASDVVFLKLNTANHTQFKNTMAEVEQVWNKLSPALPLEYKFVDESWNSLYKKEIQFQKILNYSGLISLLIACLGLFGLSIFVAERRTKEIGIRKVNGAKVSEVLSMLNRDFIKWVAIAFIIACPLAWYAMNKWLENFAYKTTLSWWVFALAGVLALSIALLTVSWQSWRAATRNPVEALRYE